MFNIVETNNFTCELLPDYLSS